MTVEREPSSEAWRDPELTPAERVADLMGRMTLRDKVAQLAGVWVGIDATSGEMAPHQHELTADAGPWEELIRFGLGQLTRAYGTAPVDPAAAARRLGRSQRQIMAASRFGIPAMVHEECLSGLMAWQATAYPAPLSWGASFDPDLVERMAGHLGRTMRTLGVHQGLAPVLDVVRDLRWGRVEETIGEDPYLVGTIGNAYVRGLESAGIVSTLKHFVGHPASRGGRNQAPVSIGRRELADVMLPPFEMALRAGARSVMNAYTEIDGVPPAADPTLLTDLLRDTYGFTGTVVADYFSISFLETQHGLAATPTDAAGLALAAGIDVELPMRSCYGDPLLIGAESGRIDEALVDRAVQRVLRQKCELGLLDPDWSPEPPVLASDGVDLDPVGARAIARELAQRSLVLLHNDGTLPLPIGGRVAVVGPQAADPGAMLGCYSFPRHVGVHHPDVPLGVAVPTVVDALRAAEHRISYAEGCPVVGGSDEGIATAAEAARDADLCVAVLGDRSGLFGGGTSGEGCDASDLRLPGRQEELLEAVLGTGTPVVLVLFVGRPYELSRQIDRLAAVVCGFFPGEEGAPALVDVLSGRINPSGRLPVSFPATGGTQPWTYLAPRLDGSGPVTSIDSEPLFPFGHGLSYAPATWGEVRAAGPTWPTDASYEITVALRNDTRIATTEVVQVYLHDPVAEVARPMRQLIATARVELAPDQTRTVGIELSADLTSYTGRAGRRQVDPGELELHIGASSRDIRAVLPVTMTGVPRTVGADRVLRPTVTVSA